MDPVRKMISECCSTCVRFSPLPGGLRGICEWDASKTKRYYVCDDHTIDSEHEFEGHMMREKGDEGCQ
jgi:hypothetical protein